MEGSSQLLLEMHHDAAHHFEVRRPATSLKAVAMFAGVAGIELGLHRAGHVTVEFCEIDPGAIAVLRKHFPGIEIVADIERYSILPEATDLITAGFPCQDLSQAGRTLGIEGSRSGLVGEVFKILRKQKKSAESVPWVLFENVPFMLRLGRGKAMRVMIDNLEELGYRWAYRVVDTRSFGLPQRRRRVFLIASQDADPRNVLLADDAGPSALSNDDVAYGFYWTEGNRGLGWAEDAIPTLKGGSSVGIPSPPAVWLTTGEIVKVGILDAERLQGFPADWTRPAEEKVRSSMRWKLVGNAVTVDVAEWIGARLAVPGDYTNAGDAPLGLRESWPDAAYNVGEGRFVANVSSWPVRRKPQHLESFLDLDGCIPLSHRATSGFLSRFEASSLRKPSGFLEALRAHVRRMEDAD